MLRINTHRMNSKNNVWNDKLRAKQHRANASVYNGYWLKQYALCVSLTGLIETILFEWQRISVEFNQNASILTTQTLSYQIENKMECLDSLRLNQLFYSFWDRTLLNYAFISTATTHSSVCKRCLFLWIWTYEHFHSIVCIFKIQRKLWRVFANGNIDGNDSSMTN